jgi:hypothetical protein
MQAATLETLSNHDLRQAALGETVGLSIGEHEPDRSAWTGMQSGGAAAQEGQGGETVWRVSVLPQERAILKAYFE